MQRLLAKKIDDALSNQVVAFFQTYYAEGNKGDLNIEKKRKNSSDGRKLRKKEREI